MPSPNPTVRRQHSGNAVPTTLSAPIVNGSDTSFTITSATGWPDGSVGNFVVTINAGLSDVEKILCSTRSGTTVNVVTRGFDSTTAAGHAATATVVHSVSAVEVDEMNQHTNATSGVHGAAGAVVGTTDSQTLTNKTLTAPTLNTPTLNTATVNSGLTATNPSTGATVITTVTGSSTGVVVQPGAASSLGMVVQGLASQVGALLRAKLGTSQTGRFIECVDQSNVTLFAVEADGSTALPAASTIGGVSGTALAADRTAWTTYTPTFTLITSPTGTFAYKLIGKTLHWRGDFSGGTATSTSATVSLPAGLTSAGRQVLFGITNGSSGVTWTVAAGGSAFTVVVFAGAGTAMSSFYVNGVIEVA